jgi:hypothetical protein
MSPHPKNFDDCKGNRTPEARKNQKMKQRAVQIVRAARNGGEKPGASTTAAVERIADALPKKLSVGADDKIGQQHQCEWPKSNNRDASRFSDFPFIISQAATHFVEDRSKCLSAIVFAASQNKKGRSFLRPFPYD